MPSLEKGNKKLLNAWAFYDWANSVYNLVITSAVFPIYYASLFKVIGITYIDIFGISVKHTALISFITAIAFLVVAFISPFLSGIADFVGNKKSFMKFFCYLGGLSCIGLFWFGLDRIYFSLVTYFLGLIGFWGSLVFYNSYLPDVAHNHQQDRISAKGYSLGYIGSVILLLINLAMIMNADPQNRILMMKYSFVLVGIWWIGFAQYSFYFLPKGNKNSQKINKKNLLNGFKELQKVGRQLSENSSLKRYLIAFFVYSMAVQTVMLVATYFGDQEIRWNSDTEQMIGLIISILAIQIIAIFGATITSRASEKVGNIPVLITINVIWITICIVAYFVYLPIHFYIVAAFVGLVMGGIQSLSRSTYSKLIPSTSDTTSFFSFYDVTEKIGIIIGMSLYGIIDQITGSVRNSIIFLALFFILGVLLLLRVPKSKSISGQIK